MIQGCFSTLDPGVVRGRCQGLQPAEVDGHSVSGSSHQSLVHLESAVRPLSHR